MSRNSCCRRSRALHARAKASDGFTLLEMIFITAVIGLLSAMAVPTVFRSRMAANETAAVGTLRSVHTAQLTFTLTCGYGLFASSFTGLGDPAGDGFLPDDLTSSATPLKSGYKYTLQEGPSGPSGLFDCHGAPISTEYYVTAEPFSIGGTGYRAFGSSQASTIWQDTTGIPPAEPFVAAGTVTAIE